LKDLGSYLKRTRISNGVSLEEAAGDMELSIAQLENIEGGNTRAFKDIYKLKELNISRYTEACSTNIGINILFLAKDKESADRAITCCEEHNVLLKRIWNKPWYKYAVYQRQLPIYRNTNLKQAQEISDCLLALPIPPILKDEQTEQLLNVIEKLVELDYLRGWF